MKRCYYDILEVDRKATQDQIKKVYSIFKLFRPIVKWLSSYILTKIHLMRPKNNLCSANKHMKLFLIQMKELSMTTIERRFSSTRMRCLKKTLKNTALDSTFGPILVPSATRALEMRREDFLKFTETSLKKSRPNR